MRKPIKMSDYSSPENLLRIFEVKFINIFEKDFPNIEESTDTMFSSCVSNVEIQARKYKSLSDYSGTIIAECLTAPDIVKYLKLSICSFITAKHYYEKNEILNFAGHLCEAHRYLGIANGMNINGAMYNSAQKFFKDRKEIGAKGGKAKAAIYTSLIPVVSKLLVTLKPIGGWKSKSEAADVISSILANRKKFPSVRNENESDRVERARQWIYKSITTKSTPLYSEFDNVKKVKV